MMSSVQQVESTPGASSARFLVVMLGERLFAIDADVARGIMTFQEKRNADVLLQEMAYRPINLAHELHLFPRGDDAGSRIVLLSEQGLRGSLPVDKVCGRLELKTSQIIPLPRHFQGAECVWYRGVLLVEQSIALILNTAWLLEKGSSSQDHDPRYDRSPVASTSRIQEERLC